MEFFRELHMKDFLAVVLTCSILCTSLLSGCAGREGNPIQTYQPGDEKRDCLSLKTEISQIDTETARLVPKADKTAWNAIMIVTGVFVIIPLFFIDLKNGEIVELQACRQRHNALELMAAQKGCVAVGDTASQPVK
jgi:hypothetical protein